MDSAGNPRKENTRAKLSAQRYPSPQAAYLLLPQPLRIRDIMLTLDESHKGPSSGLYSLSVNEEGEG